jgi:hypothetical protein
MCNSGGQVVCAARGTPDAPKRIVEAKAERIARGENPVMGDLSDETKRRADTVDARAPAFSRQRNGATIPTFYLCPTRVAREFPQSTIDR